MNFTDIKKINLDFEKKSPEEVLKWALDEFYPKITLASSFGAEDVVLIDMLAASEPKVKVFTLDTGRLNEETYELMDRIRSKYKIEIESYFPDPKKVEALERAKGFYSFRQSLENRKECCSIRKVEPLARALQGIRAWITGVRREQAVTRTGIEKIEVDRSRGGIFKINPLAAWTNEEVWDYIRKNKVPYNPLHDEGYPSIGCAPCTRAVKPGEEFRDGRWWWESKEHKECGLHLPKPDKK
ncbi:MAG: phosphoadenosine phosphosulfate reductase [Candidatus Omnitrophica bacterium CG1_02_46_14]|nr:MAG: phosphoadenosine phosphosulfate reductase [Candidatus Omnitrophica bacterium CG1_02_46_14]